MKLVIVESPAKAKTINRYLGDDYKVLASYGHVCDLPSKDGSVLPDEDFAMKWHVSGGSEKRIAEICKGVARRSYCAIYRISRSRDGAAPGLVSPHDVVARERHDVRVLRRVGAVGRLEQPQVGARLLGRHARVGAGGDGCPPAPPPYPNTNNICRQCIRRSDAFNRGIINRPIRSSQTAIRFT